MSCFPDYIAGIQQALALLDLAAVERLAQAMQQVWARDGQVLLCGNGGSAANAMHLANDLVYGASPKGRDGLRAIGLPANVPVLTCLANDLAYDEVFSYQVAVHGRPGDLLVVMSGSGNSPNVVNALIEGRRRGLATACVVGFSGGRCLHLADIAIHIPIADMQIAEDCQQILGHMLTRWLAASRVAAAAATPA